MIKNITRILGVLVAVASLATRAVEAEEPKADFICVVSAVSRDTSSPDWAVS